MTKTEQRLRTALEFLHAHGESMRNIAPPGKGDEYASAYFWFREPIYCWSKAYGDFQPQTLRAGIARGLIEQDDYRPSYRITDQGRALLQGGR